MSQGDIYIFISEKPHTDSEALALAGPEAEAKAVV